MTNTPDFSLEGFVKGVRQDIDGVYRWMYKTLFEKARQITRDPDAAKDIVQNLFARFCDSGLPRGTRFETVSKLESYLLACVFYASISYVDMIRKSSQSHKEFAALWPPEGETCNLSPTERHMIKMEVINCFYEIIETLPTKCKEVFKLIKLEQKNRTEVAALLNISVRTVDGHLARAIKLITKRAKGLRLDSYYILVIGSVLLSIFFK